MVRKGTLFFLLIGLTACPKGVDDPANFTVGNSNSNGGTTTTGTTTNSSAADTDSASGVMEGSASATTTTTSDSGPADSGSTSIDPTNPTTTGMPGTCGNGILDAGEQCEGDNLQGFDCASLGLNSGTLLCDPVMCTFDTSMCSSTSGTSG